MTIGKRLIVLFITVYVFALAAAFTVSELIVLPAFHELEREGAIRDVNNFVEALNRETYYLDRVCSDWAAWDEAYNIMLSDQNLLLNGETPEDLLGPIFESSEVNLIYGLRTDGSVKIGYAFDLETRTQLNLKEFPSDRFDSLHPLLEISGPMDHVSGLIITEKGPMVVSARPITSSDRDGPIAGILIMGRFLNERMKESLQEQISHKLSFVSSNQENPAPWARGMLSNFQNSEKYYFETNSNILYAHSFIKDIFGKPSLLYRIEVPRDITHQGTRVRNRAISFAIIGGLLIILVLNFIVRSLVVKRVEKISAEVSRIGTTGDTSIRLDESGNDDISILCKNINKTLDSLEDAGKEIKMHRDRLEDLVEQRTRSMEEVNQELELEVSDRKRAEDALRFQAQLLDSVTESVIATDLDGNIIYWGAGAEKLYGYSKDSIINKQVFRLVPDDSRREEEQRLKHVLAHGSWRGQYTKLKNDGTPFPADTVLSLAKDDNGNTFGIIGIDRDISEKLKTEKQREEMGKQFLQAQKMESVGRLAGGLAHDFNNMLGVVTGYTQLVMSELDENSSEWNDLSRVLTAAHRAKDLTLQLLTFARHNKPEFKTVPVSSVIEELTHMLDRGSLKKVRIETTIKDDCLIKADRGQLEQALMNVCLNSFDAMPEGGDLTIDCSETRLSQKFCDSHPGCVPGRYCSIRITDTGSGIPDDIIEKVFEPFFTTKGIGKGTGLGLAATHGIVNNHDGYINISSTMGQGSVFEIFIPLSRDTDNTDVREPDEFAIQSCTGTIMVIDDEQSVIALIDKILKRAGYDTVCVRGGREAIEVYKEKGAEIDLVLLDMLMPEMDGVDVFAELLTIDSEVKVIIASGYLMDREIPAGLKKSAQAFIQKPFVMSELYSAIKQVLNRQ